MKSKNLIYNITFAVIHFNLKMNFIINIKDSKVIDNFDIITINFMVKSINFMAIKINFMVKNIIINFCHNYQKSIISYLVFN